MTTSYDILGEGGLFARTVPGYEVRQPQVRFADAIDEAIGHGHVVAELGTGTGKSYGYLIPGLLAGQTLLVTTSVKSLQEQLIGKDLPYLAQALLGVLGREVRFCAVKGKANYACRRQVEKLQNLGAYATPEAAADAPRFFDWYATTTTGDLDEFNPPLHHSLRQDVCGEDCNHQACFGPALKAYAKTADVVVANHALTLLDGLLRSQNDDQAKVLPDAEVLVLDEAHGLVEWACKTLGAEVSFGGWGRVVRKLERLGGSKWGFDAKPVADALEAWTASIDQRLERSQERQLVLGDERRYAEPVATEAARLERYARLNVPDALVGEDRDAWASACDAILSFASRVTRIGSAAQDEDPDLWVRYAERVAGEKRSRIILYARPVEVADQLRSLVWERFQTVVACSATLATPNGPETMFSFFRREAGLPENAPVIEQVAPSPFPYERNARLYVSPASAITADRGREQAKYFAQQAEEVYKLVMASQGRAFCLFTSNAALRAVHQIVAPRLPAHYRVFVQGEASRTAIVEAFRDEAQMFSAPCVLFGTRTFFEGVDVAGRGLELVILDNLPFPVPSEPVYAAKCRRIARQEPDPTKQKWAHFRVLTLPLVTTVVKQVVGRLIRTNTDRGVVAILDRRIVENGYGAGMRRALPPMPLTERLGDVEEVFS